MRRVSRKDIEALEERVKPVSEKPRVVCFWPDERPDDYEPGPNTIVTVWPHELPYDYVPEPNAIVYKWADDPAGSDTRREAHVAGLRSHEAGLERDTEGVIT